MRVRRRHMPVLAAAGVVVGMGLALLLALFVGVGRAHAEILTETRCGYSEQFDAELCCTQTVDTVAEEISFTCWFTDPTDRTDGGCTNFTLHIWFEGEQPHIGWTCNDYYNSDSIWLADVCEPEDGFSANGEMTWDSTSEGPLQFGASMEGPWYTVEVNGPPWVVTEENMEAFAAMAGVGDWHDLWVRSGDGYPQHVGNAVIERDGRMNALCAE